MVSAIKSLVGYGIVISDPVALNTLLADGEPGNVRIGTQELILIERKLSASVDTFQSGDRPLFEVVISHSERASGMAESPGYSPPPPAVAIHYLGGYGEGDDYAHGQTLEVWAQDKSKHEFITL